MKKKDITKLLEPIFDKIKKTNSHEYFKLAELALDLGVIKKQVGDQAFLNSVFKSELDNTVLLKLNHILHETNTYYHDKEAPQELVDARIYWKNRKNEKEH